MSLFRNLRNGAILKEATEVAAIDGQADSTRSPSSFPRPSTAPSRSRRSDDDARIHDG